MEKFFPYRNFSPHNNNHNELYRPTLSSSVSSSSSLISSSDHNNVQNPNSNLPEDLYNLDQNFSNLSISSNRHENQNHHGLMPINPTYQPDLQYHDFLERLKVESILMAEENGGGMYLNSVDHPFSVAAEEGLNSSTIHNNNNNNGLINYWEFADAYNTKMPKYNESCGCYYLHHFRPLEEYKGKIHLIAKEQQGCKFLQRILEIGNPEEILMIYSEIKDHILQLMKDPFANYLIQKFFVLCTPNQITQLLIGVVLDSFSLIELCQNTHGYVPFFHIYIYITNFFVSLYVCVYIYIF